MEYKEYLQMNKLICSKTEKKQKNMLTFIKNWFIFISWSGKTHTRKITALSEHPNVRVSHLGHA